MTPDATPKPNHSLLVLFGFLAFTLAVGFVAGQVTAPNIPSWYSHLAKPSCNPPNWVFAPVWTALYVMIAVAGWLIWRKTGFKNRALGIWGTQLALNFNWSLIFFGGHQLGGALIDLIGLWLTIAAAISAFWRIDRRAAWLFVPYLAWVSFAGVLNFWIWQLNG
jgi:translocator protein